LHTTCHKIILTHWDGAVLQLGVRELPPTTITILFDRDRYYLDVTIAGREYDLGRYDTADEIGAAAAKWVHDRGLLFAPGSGNRLAEAQRLGSCCVRFDLVRDETSGMALS